MTDEEPDAEPDGSSAEREDGFLPPDDGGEAPHISDDADGRSEVADPPGEVDFDTPLGDIADRTRRSRDGPADDDVMEAFSEVDVDDVDVDQLWSELEDDDLGETVDEPHGSSERDVRVVSKRDYCQRCQYFSAPPEVRCNHAAGEILEMVDTEQFRVADCPILRGEEELENLRR